LPTSRPGSTSSPKCPLGAAHKKRRATKSKSGLLCLDGSIGQWFPIARARLLLTDVKLGRNALKQVPLLEQKSSFALQRVKLLELQVGDSEKIAETWRQAAQEQAKALQSQHAWYKSPTLWFAVGLVLGVGGVTAAVVAK
jgi:hypothetical protein